MEHHANEFCCLTQGVGSRIKNPTNMIHFITKTQVPRDRKWNVTYGSFACTVCPAKANMNHTCFTVSGDKINFLGEVATPTVEMLVTKIFSTAWCPHPIHD